MKPAKKNPRKEPAKDTSLLLYIFVIYTIIFIPVFHIPRALDQGLMPRTMALSVFVLFMAIWLLGMKKVNQFNFSIFRRNIFPVLLGYLAVVIASIAFATNYKESFFDIVRTFLFVSVVGISGLVFVHADGWQEKLPKFVIVASGIALIIGAVEYYEHVITGTVTLLPDGRPVIYLVDGLMFHKNEYSTALMLMLPFVGYAIYVYKGAWRAAAIVTALLLLIMIVLVQTRAVWVGLAVSFAAVTVIYVFYSRSLNLPLLYRNILIGGMVAGLIGVAVIFSIEKPKNPTSLLGRVRSITDTGSKDNVHRLNIWKSTIEMIKDRPFTGIGAGNWRLNAAYYFDGRFDQVPQLNWARPHNDFLWVFAEKGIIGFLLYLAYFGYAFYYLLQIIRRSPKTQDKILALLFFAGIIAYLAVSFFSFPYERINHQMYLGIFLGGSIAMLQSFSPARPFNPSRRAILTPVIIFSVFGAIYGYNTTVQENYLNKALSAMKSENWRAYLHNAQLATNPFKSLDPLSNPPEYYEGMALAKLNRHPEALVAYEKAFKQFPNNMWILNWMGQSYYQVGRYEEAIECLEKVIKIIPDHKEAYINLSATYFKMRDYQQSADALKRIKDWEKDEAVVRNLGALENLMKSESDNP